MSGQPINRRHSSPTLDDSDVYAANRSQYDDPSEIIDALTDQPTVPATADQYHCTGGDKGFRVYLTDFPIVRAEDLEPGILLYRPTTSPLSVYEVRSEPYRHHGVQQVDVIRHSRAHAGDDPTIRSHKTTVHQSLLTTKFTVLQPGSVQQTLNSIQ